MSPAAAPGYLDADFTAITPTHYLLEVAPLWEGSYTVEAGVPTASRTCFERTNTNVAFPVGFKPSGRTTVLVCCFCLNLVLGFEETAGILHLEQEVVLLGLRPELDLLHLYHLLLLLRVALLLLLRVGLFALFLLLLLVGGGLGDLDGGLERDPQQLLAAARRRGHQGCVARHCT